MNKLKQWLDIALENPGWKTFFSVIIPLFASVLSGTFVVEITDLQGLRWHLFYKAWSFYGLIFLIVIIFYYNRAIYLRELEIMRFSDIEYCIAYMRSKCLPQAAEKYKELIRDGRGDELSQLMAELKKSLK